MDRFEIEDMKKRYSQSEVIGDDLRGNIVAFSKDFKTSWVRLGQALFVVWQDKYFKAWGYSKFEYYLEKEVGLKKDLALKLLKTYYFLEQDEPDYLKEKFGESREATQVPGYEAVNVLRLAKQKKEILKEDYVKLKKAVFEKGKDASWVRKDLTAIMKERKPIDPDEEREKRHEASIRRLVTSLKSFQKDMEALKLAPANIIQEAKEFMAKLESQIAS